MLKKVKLINHDCLPILMLYIVLAYIMLFAALCTAVCLYNASSFSFFLPLIFANAFCFHALSWFVDTVCLFQVCFSIMRSAFNLLVFPNSMFTPFFI